MSEIKKIKLLFSVSQSSLELLFSELDFESFLRDTFFFFLLFVVRYTFLSVNHKLPLTPLMASFLQTLVVFRISSSPLPFTFFNHT